MQNLEDIMGDLEENVEIAGSGAPTIGPAIIYLIVIWL